MHLSFELFPPSTERGFDQLIQTCHTLAALKPTCVTLTCGAMGNKPTNIIDFLDKLSAQVPLQFVPHLTCTYGTKAELDKLATSLWDKNYRTVVALRGDVPDGFSFTVDHCPYANDLIALLRNNNDFQIYVAAYPEKHPMSPSLEADIQSLKRKVDAGATGIFTQFFFDPEIFLTFRDQIRAAGITVPLIAGLIPLYPYAQVKNFADKCMTKVPMDFVPSNAEQAAEYLLQQCQTLIKGGVDGFHFYCLNRPEIVAKVVKNLEL